MMWKITGVVAASIGVLATGLSSSPPISSASSAASAALERSWRIRTAVSTLQGIRGRDGSSATKYGDGGKTGGRLSLLHDFHDPKTGLCGEGVWHNSMLGIALVKASRSLRENDGADAIDGEEAATLADEYEGWARRLATNLFELNYVDGKGFRRRSASGIWESIAESQEASDEDEEFYQPSEDRRCISNAAAVLFVTYLRENFPEDSKVAAMADKCSDVFFEEFFDKKSGRFRYEAGGSTDDQWRSSDQALGIMACLRLMQGVKDRVEDGTLPRRKLFEIRTMAAVAAEKLMDDFNFSPYATEGLVSPVNTIGMSSSGDIPNYRNSWHDSLACFAILASNATSGRESPVGLCRFMARDYGIVSNHGDEESDEQERQLLLAHDVQENRFRDGPNAYTCTQAIWDACRRANGADIAGFCDFFGGLQSFHKDSSVKENGGTLSAVGTAYPMIRLWANTELAAWLLIEPADFAI